MNMHTAERTQPFKQIVLCMGTKQTYIRICILDGFQIAFYSIRTSDTRIMSFNANQISKTKLLYFLKIIQKLKIENCT